MKWSPVIGENVRQRWRGSPRCPASSAISPMMKRRSSWWSKSGSRDATSRQKQRPSLNFCLPPTQNPAPATPQVDKNNAFLSIFVYRRLKIRLPHPRNPKRTKQCFPRSFARCNATTSHQPALHFQCKKAESPLHPRKFRIDHPNVPYLTTITEQGAF